MQLSVKDSYGNWSLPQTTVVNVDSHKMASEANYKFNALIPGEIFLNQARFNFNELDTVVPTVTQPTGTTLIASNNPEKVPSKGILYSDRATGNVRLRYHHENNSNQLLEIMMLAQNKTDKPITLVVKKTGFSGPTTNAMQAGYKVIENYLTSITINQTIVLAPNEIYQINEVRGKLQQGEIVSAIIDVTCDGVLDFTMAALGDTNKPADVKYLSQLPKIKTHVRGTFTNADLLLDYQYAGQKASKIIIGRDDAFAGYFLPGVDATSGTAIENSGARAVTHTITIHNNGNEKVGLLINPRGLIFRGVIECAGEIVNISNQGLINDSAEAAVIATFEPNETKTLRYLPPSGSDTPILLVLLPESQWKNF